MKIQHTIPPAFLAIPQGAISKKTLASQKAVSPPNSSAKAPRFGAAPAVNMGAFLRVFDFTNPLITSVPAIQLIYAAIIASRVAVAASRSRNEFREVTTRDAIGFASWFYFTPILNRLLVRFAPGVTKDVKQTILHIEGEQAGKIGQYLNPKRILDWGLASRHQLEEQEKTTLKLLGNKLKSLGEAAEPAVKEALKTSMKETETFYTKAKGLRNLAYLGGVLNTFFMLGMGIPIINNLLTFKNVQKQKAALLAKQQANGSALIGAPMSAKTPVLNRPPVSSFAFPPTSPMPFNAPSASMVFPRPVAFPG